MQIRLAFLASSLLSIGCSPEDAVSNNSYAEAADYLNEESCWRKESEDTIRAALAIFEVRGVTQTLIFSERCAPGNDYNSLRKSLRVRVRCVTGIPEVVPCKAHSGTVELDEQVFDPGVRPQFPKQMYVIEGRLLPVVDKGDDYLVFTEVDVKRYQKVPVEMQGAFLLYPFERQGLIQEYLNARSVSEDGYRMSK